MSNNHNLRIIVIRILLLAFCQHVKYSRGYDGWECQCDCVYDTPKKPRCQMNPPAPETYIANFDYIPQCLLQNDTEIPKCDVDMNRFQSCQNLTDCCFEEDIDLYSSSWSSIMSIPGNLTCSYGPDTLCDLEECYLPTAQNCICYHGYYEYDDYVSITPKTSANEQLTTPKPSPNEQLTTPATSANEQSTTLKTSSNEQSTTPKTSSANEKSKNGFGIGLGVGIGICVFIAAHIALLVYCRLKGRGEGQGKAQGTLPKGALPGTDANRQDDNEEYAEIDSYIGDATMKAVTNQAYSSSDVVFTPGQSNQAYTSLNDPAINSHQYKSLKKPNQDLGSGDYADPEKYTEPPVLPQRNSNVIDDEDDDEDYVSQGTPEPATNNDDSRDDYTLEPTAPSSDNVNSSAQSNPKEPPTPSSDYVSVDTQNHPNSKSPSSDYVSVDTPDHSSPISTSSDYVSVDTQDHPNSKSQSSDYVSVDTADHDTEENDNSSDYVDC